MRCAIYIRVSTDEQASEGFSLSAQEERCRNFLQSQGWEFHQLYLDDGYSAKDLDRPAMKQMLEDMKQKDFDVVVVYRLDRLTRSVIDLHHLLNEFDQHKVSFKSVTEVFDTTTAMGRFLITLVGAIAQWERENLAERVLMGQERKMLEGKRIGAAPPFGYRLEDGELVVIPEEAEIVRQIFELYRYNGMPTIAKLLNEQGLKTKKGLKWSTYAIKYILQNPVYMGDLRWKYRKDGKKRDPKDLMLTEGSHEPIISQELFEEIQSKIKVRAHGPSKSLTSDFPFSGVLLCARCGANMLGGTCRKKNGYVWYQYHCRTRRHFGTCDMPSVSEYAVANTFLENTKWFIDGKNYEKPADEQETEIIRRREAIEKEIARIRKRRKNYSEMRANEEITKEEFQEYTSEDRIREEQLLSELSSLPDPANNPISRLTKEEFIEQISNLKYYWEHAERHERKEIIHSLFSKIYIDVEEQKLRGKVNKVKIVDYEF